MEPRSGSSCSGRDSGVKIRGSEGQNRVQTAVSYLCLHGENLSISASKSEKEEARKKENCFENKPIFSHKFCGTTPSNTKYKNQIICFENLRKQG